MNVMKQDTMDNKIKERCKKKKKNEMHVRLSQSIEEVSRIYREEANLDGLRIC